MWCFLVVFRKQIALLQRLWKDQSESEWTHFHKLGVLLKTNSAEDLCIKMQAMQSLVKARAVADRCVCVCMDLGIRSKHTALRLWRALFLPQRCKRPLSHTFLSDFYRAPELSSTFLQPWKNRPVGTQTLSLLFWLQFYILIVVETPWNLSFQHSSSKYLNWNLSSHVANTAVFMGVKTCLHPYITVC